MPLSRTTATTTGTSRATAAPGSSSAPAREYGMETCRVGGELMGLMKRGMDPAAPFLSAGTPSEQHRWSCKPSSRCFTGLMFPSLPFSHPSSDPRSRQQRLGGGAGRRLFFWQHELPSRKFVSGGGKILLRAAGTPELNFVPLQPQTASPHSRGLRSTEVLMLRVY